MNYGLRCWRTLNIKKATKNLQLNDIGNVVLTTAQKIPFTSYQEDRELGGFIIIDKILVDLFI